MVLLSCLEGFNQTAPVLRRRSTAWEFGSPQLHVPVAFTKLLQPTPAGLESSSICKGFAGDHSAEAFQKILSGSCKGTAPGIRVHWLSLLFALCFREHLE